jgi:thymidylate synthase (FAD)
MPGFVLPKVYLVGATQMEMDGVKAFLRETGQEAFLEEVYEAEVQGVPGGMILCSIYAKLCYRAFTLGKNTNLTRTRSIEANIQGTFAQGHGSVFEHCLLNFIVTGCSRVYTHEQVRHRQQPPRNNQDALDNDLAGDGVAYSQTSGRYCRLDELNLVIPPDLDPCKDLLWKCLGTIEDTVYLMECKLGLREPPKDFPKILPENVAITGDERTRWVPSDRLPFDVKKKLTSAIRRIAPNGQDNEMGMSLNIRSVRHVVELRTAPSAEWEIRYIYAQVYRLLNERFPLLFSDATVVEDAGDGLPWVRGMKQQPY